MDDPGTEIALLFNASLNNEGVYLDWDSNCDVIEFKITVPDQLADSQRTARQIDAEERDMHGDFGWVYSAEIALEALSKDIERIKASLKDRYPELC